MHAQSKALRAAAPATLTFDASYESLVNRYFTDVAHDSLGTDNVYSVATQYYDNPGHVPIQYQSTFGGAYIANNPLPANGCSDGVDTYCLTDQQLQAEIQTVLTANGWHGGLTNTFFLLTPQGVGSCGDATTNQCSTNAFCAYHSDFLDASGEHVIYANEPYEGQSTGCTGPGQGFPNDVDADTTINTISHEHNEAITDPLGTAWYSNDASQDENGDLCAYNYGSPSGVAGNGQPFNQLMNGHDYSLQQEFSNTGDNCLQKSTQEHGAVGTTLAYHGGPVMHTNTTYAIYWLPTAGNASPPVVTGSAAVKSTLTTSPGTWNGAPSGYSYQWQRCSTAGTDCVAIPGATAATYKLTSADGLHTLRSTIRATNVNGTSSATASAATAVVIAVPALTKAPRISGRARVGKRLSASRGTWIGPPTVYRFQWLRCNSRGKLCKRVRGATRTKFRLTKRDAKHRLRLRVTAVDAAGSRTAISRATARVPAKR